MAAVPNRRHQFAQVFRDPDGTLWTGDAEPFRFQPLEDNRLHVVRQGDTLHVLAERYFAGEEYAAGLWWVIADFQPDPILDPTLLLAPGTTLFIPSLSALRGSVLSGRRRGLDLVG